MKLFSVFILAITANVSISQLAGDHPPCEICGCSWCEEGSFPMSNLQGMLDMEDLVSAYDHIPGHDNQTAAAMLDELPFDSFPCFLLDMSSNSGAVEEDQCNDEIRLNPVMRHTCGCPPLPPAPPGVVNVFGEETATTTSTEPASISGDHPPCEICGCSWCEEGLFPMSNRQGILDIEDWMSVYDVPEDVDKTVAEMMADAPLDSFPCSLLDMIGQTGGLDEEQCVDDIRLNPVMRDVCGCPPLPPSPPGVVNIFEEKKETTTTETTITTTPEEEATSLASPGDEDTIVLEGSAGYLVAIVWAVLVFLAVALGVLLYIRKQKKELAPFFDADGTVDPAAKLSVIA